MIGFTVQSLGGHQSWSGCYGQEKFSLAYLESNQVSSAVQSSYKPPYRLRYFWSFIGNIYGNIVLQLFTSWGTFKPSFGSGFNFRLQLMTCFITLTCFLYFTSTFGSIVSGLNSNIATDIETNVQYPINQKNAYLNT